MSMKKQQFLKIKMSQGEGGGGQKSAINRHVLFEWPLTISYVTTFVISPRRKNVVEIQFSASICFKIVLLLSARHQSTGKYF